MQPNTERPGRVGRARTGRVPRAEQDAAVGRVLLDLADDLGQLVDALARVVGRRVLVLCAKVPPLEAVDGAEVALGAVAEPARGEEGRRAVAVPDVDALLGERQRRRRARDEPEELLPTGARREGTSAGSSTAARQDRGRRTSSTPRKKTRLVVSSGSRPSASEKRSAGGAKRAIVPVPVRSGRCWPVAMMVRIRLRYWSSSCGWRAVGGVGTRRRGQPLARVASVGKGTTHGGQRGTVGCGCWGSSRGRSRGHVGGGEAGLS